MRTRWGRSIRKWCGGGVVGCAVLFAVPAQAQAAPTLTFSDEFNGSLLDLTKWGFHTLGPRNDGFSLPTAAVGGGVLTIKTYTLLGVHFTSQIHTQKQLLLGFDQAYGYFEARVKFNDSPGMWSSFWLQSPTFGSPIGDPQTAGVEMDIAEHRVHCVEAPAPTPPETCSQTSDISDRIQQALIWDGYGAESQSAVKLSDPLAGLGNDSWHTWGLAWSPTGLTFYYDGAPTWTQAGPISQHAEYIVLGSEVGQFFAGAIPPGGYGSYSASTTNLQVDYVRVWSLD